ncbi:MAG: ABC transporter permease [Candidatus Limnocylindria bacterium]
MAEGEPLILWDWIVDHLDEVVLRTLEHLGITVVAVAVGFVISLVLAIAISRRRSLYGPVTAVAGVLYTVPSLALFGLLIPFTGFSFLTLEIALVSYTILILVRNIVAGLDAVPEDIIEAAMAMGYTTWQRLWSVEMPLALPVVVTGLRIATVTTIGLVAIAELINQGGLSYFIIERGLLRFFPTAIILGSVLSILLAVGADVAFVRLQRLVTPYAQARTP